MIGPSVLQVVRNTITVQCCLCSMGQVTVGGPSMLSCPKLNTIFLLNNAMSPFI